MLGPKGGGELLLHWDVPWQTQLTARCRLIFGQPIEGIIVSPMASEGLAKAGSLLRVSHCGTKL